MLPRPTAVTLALCATLAACAARPPPSPLAAVASAVPGRLRTLEPSVELGLARGDDAPCAQPAWSAAFEALLAQSGDARGAVTPPRPWDQRTPPRYIDRVERRFALTSDERELLVRQGFVVPDRLEAAGYAQAFHQVHQAELPVYVSVDASLHAVAALHGPLVAYVEAHTLAPMLARVLRRMHEALPALAREVSPEAAFDADLVVSVARSLLEHDDGYTQPALGPQRAVADLAHAVRTATRSGERYLFGRPRRMDFTAYATRGLYASDPALARYQRAAAWLSRLELNVLSRGCRSSHAGDAPDARETPREALAALALAALAERAGVTDDLLRLDQLLSLVHGRREDLSLPQLAVMRDVVRITDLRAGDVFERLASVARNQPRRALRTHPMPDGDYELPVVASVLGARVRPAEVLPDVIVAPEHGRATPTGPEAAYALGAEYAARWVDAPLGEHPERVAEVARARDAVRDTVGGNDLPSNWFRGLTALAEAPTGRTPAYLRTPAFEDLRVNSLVAGYGQFLRRDEARAEEPVGAVGCRIPTGWVDPVPAVYESLGAWADRALAMARTAFSLDPARPEALRARDDAWLRALDAQSLVLRALARIARDELEGRTPTELHAAVFASVAELDADASLGPARHEGWYFGLFPDVDAALARADFAVEWGGARGSPTHTWLGASAPRLGVFVVDNGGHPFVAVGPVARAWELAAQPGTRVDRALARARTESSSPWSSSWLVAQSPEPPLAVTLVDPADARERVFVVRSRERVGAVTLELLDAHGAVLGAVTRVVSGGVEEFRFARPVARVDDRARHTGNRPRYIDNTRGPWTPYALRIRAPGFWHERPLGAGAPLRLTLGGAEPVDARGDVVARGR